MLGLKSGRTNAFRFPSASVKSAVLGLLLLPLAGPAAAYPGEDGGAPDLGDCERLRVQAGSRVVFHAYAEGVQVYRWNGTRWAFFAPEAELFADPGGNGLVGSHYSGPTWESNNGGIVVGAIVDRCTADPDAIDWLLLEAASEGYGTFQGVTFIQRVNTEGGIAPAYPGDFPGQETRVPYSAEYFFYRSADNPIGQERMGAAPTDDRLVGYVVESEDATPSQPTSWGQLKAIYR